MSSLSLSTNVTKDTTNNTVTYSNGNTWYPDIFQYETGGKIDTTPTSGIIGQSESYRGYNGLTNVSSSLTNSTKPSSLTIPYTYYNTEHVYTDFTDTEKANKYQSIFFGTDSKFWVASRSYEPSSIYASVRIRAVDRNLIEGSILWTSQPSTYGNANNAVCPIITIPSSIEVMSCSGTNNSSNPHIVVTE